jgi:hypothetical protein
MLSRSRGAIHGARSCRGTIHRAQSATDCLNAYGACTRFSHRLAPGQSHCPPTYPRLSKFAPLPLWGCRGAWERGLGVRETLPRPSRLDWLGSGSQTTIPTGGAPSHSPEEAVLCELVARRRPSPRCLTPSGRHHDWRLAPGQRPSPSGLCITHKCAMANAAESAREAKCLRIWDLRGQSARRPARRCRRLPYEPRQGRQEVAHGVSPGERRPYCLRAPEGRQRAALGVSPARQRRTDCRPFRAQRPLGAPLPDGLRHRLPSAAPSEALTTQGPGLRRIGIWGAGREWVEPGQCKTESAVVDALSPTSPRPLHDVGNA